MKDTSLAISLSGLSFMLAVIWGMPLLRVLGHFKIGKVIRMDGPSSHLVKMGTPTMGGLMFVVPVLLLTGLLNAGSLIGLPLIGQGVLLPMLVMAAFAGLGAVDDWEGIRGPRCGLGMRARTKLLIQIAFALGVAVVLYQQGTPHLFLFGTNAVELNLGLMYIPIAALVIVTFSNAINFTDGLDGLAGLISVTAFVTYGTIALTQEQVFLGRFCFTIVGALFAYLWFNVHPAQLIMGDTGALALGATLGVVALLTGQWLLLPLAAMIPCAELLSVILQVGYFKLTHGKRLFKMAPLHHHFELLGWSETQVVQRFWLISLLGAMLAVAFAAWD